MDIVYTMCHALVLDMVFTASMSGCEVSEVPFSREHVAELKKTKTKERRGGGGSTKKRKRKTLVQSPTKKQNKHEDTNQDGFRQT